MVPINSELNSTHFQFNISGLHFNWPFAHLEKRYLLCSIPEGVDKYVFECECFLFYLASLYCLYWQLTTGNLGICH